MKTTYHKDNTVTLWNCITSQWERSALFDDETLATLGTLERLEVLAHTIGLLDADDAALFADEAKVMLRLFKRQGRAAPRKVGKGMWLGLSCFGRAYKDHTTRQWRAQEVRVRLYRTQDAARNADPSDRIGIKGCLSVPL